jgi:homocysteine S-methyltransferase
MTQIIDGGLSTELERIGASCDGPLWTGRTLLDTPQLIEEAHRHYVTAGADVIITSSYQLSRQGFQQLGLTPDDADAALRLSVEVARRAVLGTSSLVAASIGPYGAILHDGSEYRGNYGLSYDALIRFHRERIEILIEASPDILLAETIPDLDEARALTEVLDSADRPVWISFTSLDGAHLPCGATIEEALRTIENIPQLDVIGFNCVQPELVTQLVKRAQAVTTLPIAIYANMGGEWSVDGWKNQGTQKLSEWWREWEALNLASIGGCCGTDSLQIADLNRVVNQ